MIEPMSLLTEEDKVKIDGYISHYGGCDGTNMDVIRASLDYLLRFWNKEKSELLDFMGGKLIVEKELDIEYPRSLLVEDMEDRLYSPKLEFINEYHNWLSRMRFYEIDYTLYSDLCSLLSMDSLCANEYDPFDKSYRADHLIPVPEDGKPIAMNRGCKVIKLLAKIAKAYNLAGFEEFRIAHSMVLNKKRFKGTLCVSIHPLDYMTMSDNDCDWDSCMSWQKPGEYRQGTVEMMNSDKVIVAYLKSHTDMELYGNKTWNNKRWRELFIVNQDFVAGIKGYPYCDTLLEDEVYTLLRELMNKNKPEWAWEEQHYLIDECSYCKLKDDVEIYMLIVTHIMFNDFEFEQKIYPGPSIYPKIMANPRYEVMLSGATECLCCGDDWTDKSCDFNDEYLMCPTCTGEYLCEECGEYISEDQAVYFADDEDATICRYCADRVGEICDSCGDHFHSYNINRIYLNHLGTVDDYTNIKLCNCCTTENPLVDDIGPIEWKPRSQRFFGNRYQVNSKNLTDKGFNTFGFFGREIKEFRDELLAEESED